MCTLLRITQIYYCVVDACGGTYVLCTIPEVDAVEAARVVGRVDTVAAGVIAATVVAVVAIVVATVVVVVVIVVASVVVVLSVKVIVTAPLA